MMSLRQAALTPTIWTRGWASVSTRDSPEGGGMGRNWAALCIDLNLPRLRGPWRIYWANSGFIGGVGRNMNEAGNGKRENKGLGT